MSGMTGGVGKIFFQRKKKRGSAFVEKHCNVHVDPIMRIGSACYRTATTCPRYADLYVFLFSRLFAFSHAHDEPPDLHNSLRPQQLTTIDDRMG